MTTFVYHDGSVQRPLRLYDHENGDWNPVATGAVEVAGLQFPSLVPVSDAPATHYVVHPANRNTIVDNVLNRGSVGDQAVVLQCSNLDRLSEDHLIHRVGHANWVILRMKNGDALRKNEEWLPEFLRLSVEQAVALARATSRHEVSSLEEKFGHFLDIILPRPSDITPALSVLCQGYLAVWASGRTDAELDERRDKPTGLALKQMGWDQVDKATLPADLRGKLDEVSNREHWWQPCFAGVEVTKLVKDELPKKVPLAQTTYLKHLVAWIVANTSLPASIGTFEDIVAGAFNELCEGLRCHDR